MKVKKLAKLQIFNYVMTFAESYFTNPLNSGKQYISVSVKMIEAAVFERSEVKVLQLRPQFTKRSHILLYSISQ